MIYPRTDDGHEQCTLECRQMERRTGRLWHPVRVNMKGHRDIEPQPYWQARQVPLTASEAYDEGLFVMVPPPVPTVRWTRSDWLSYVTFTVPISDGHEVDSIPEGAVWYRRDRDV